MEKQLVSEINQTITELLQLVSAFNQEQINIIPFEGSWTAGQLSRHLIMSNSGFVNMMNGPVEQTERGPADLVERIKSDFLDFNTKTESPDFIKPPKMTYNKVQLVESLEDIRKKIVQAIESLDLTKTCLLTELPVYGFLTRLEAIHFVLYHTQRHIHQLEKIYEKTVQSVDRL